MTTLENCCCGMEMPKPWVAAEPFMKVQGFADCAVKTICTFSFHRGANDRLPLRSTND